MIKFVWWITSAERKWDVAVRQSFLSARMLLVDGRMGRGINFNITLKRSFTMYSSL